MDSEPTAATIQEQEGISRNNARGAKILGIFFGSTSRLSTDDVQLGKLRNTLISTL